MYKQQLTTQKIQKTSVHVRTVNKWDNTEAEEKISTGYDAKIGVKVKKSKSRLFPCDCRMLPEETANCVVIVWINKMNSSAVGNVSDK